MVVSLFMPLPDGLLLRGRAGGWDLRLVGADAASVAIGATRSVASLKRAFSASSAWISASAGSLLCSAVRISRAALKACVAAPLASQGLFDARSLAQDASLTQPQLSQPASSLSCSAIWRSAAS